MVREKKEPIGVKEEFLEGGIASVGQGTDEDGSGGRSSLAPFLTPDVESGAPFTGDDDERKPSARNVAISAANTSGSLPNFKDQVSDPAERRNARRPNPNGGVASALGVPVIDEQNEDLPPSTVVAQAIMESSSATTDLRKHIVWAVAFVVGLVALAVTVTLAVVLSSKDGGGDDRSVSQPQPSAPPVSVSPTPAPNLALNKPATQSTTSDGGIAARAVDGNTNGDFHMVGSVTHTNGLDTTPPWWRVNLEGDYYIRQIIVYNRSDCCSERLFNATIELIQEDGTPHQLLFFELVQQDGIVQPISQFVGNTSGVETISWSFDGASFDPPTRMIQVSLPQPGHLSLAEVEVFGIEVS